MAQNNLSGRCDANEAKEMVSAREFVRMSKGMIGTVVTAAPDKDY